MALDVAGCDEYLVSMLGKLGGKLADVLGGAAFIEAGYDD
jgi:hypothetical protein